MTFRAPLITRIPARPARQDWIWSTADTLLQPPGSRPFAQHVWPNPTGAPYPVALRTWTQNLLESTLAPVVVVPFVPSEWPNPGVRSSRQDWVAGTPDTLLNPPGLNPNRLSDWPNPLGVPFPIDLRTFLNGTNIALAPPPSVALPFSLLDWPNPTGAPFPIEDRGFILPTNILNPIPPPVPPADDSRATPGRVRRHYEEYLERQREKELRARLDEPAPVQPAEYVEKTERIAKAVTRLRDETERYRAESAELRLKIAALETQNRAKALAKAEKDLLLKEQAITLARAQEAALLEEMEVLDIAYVAAFALSMLIQ